MTGELAKERDMRRQRATQAGLALVLGALGFGLARATPPVTVSGRVERGRYLVSAIGCGACHTPKTMTATGPKSLFREPHSGREHGHRELVGADLRGRTADGPAHGRLAPD